MPTTCLTRVSSLVAAPTLALALLLAAPAGAEDAPDAPARPVAGLMADGKSPFLRIPGAPGESTLYATGERIMLESETVWRYICGSDTTGRNADDLQRIAAAHAAEFADPSTVRIVDSGARGAFNVVFQLAASVPAAAVPSFAQAEAYIESHFEDASTVTVTVAFGNLGAGVIGSTGSNYASSVTWANSRDGLIAGKDADDVIQDSLPTGTTIPVRYTGNSATVTAETRVFFTRANFRAALGTVTGTDASMTYNNTFAFDFDPADGVSPGALSLVDTIVHETGHAMGFTSAADFRTNDIEALDIFRFAFNDGAGTDWNPDTLAEFQTTARCVDNNLPDDDVQSDIISAEYRMSDGNPRQASHFREGLDGIMDPTLSSGQTFFPNFFRQSDTDMFDAIGYDFFIVCMDILGNPAAQQVEEGQDVTFNVSVTGTGPFTYQWRKDGDPLTNSAHISGAGLQQLTIHDVTTLDEGLYDCIIDNDCDTQTSTSAQLTVNAACPGDANGDNIVNFNDLNIVLGQFGQSGPPGALEGDLNDDGRVDFLDLNLVLGFYGAVC